MNIQNILTDTRLTLQAKAIYLYLQQQAQGAEELIMKPPKEIQIELGIGSHQYYSHLHILENMNYIQIKKTRNGHLYSNNKCIFRNGERKDG